MSFIDYSPTLRGMSRVFILEGRARPDHSLDYQGCMMVGGIDQSLGDITAIKCPSPDSYNQWDEVGAFQGEEGRPSTTLTALYPLDIVSTLERLKRERCPYDVHINLGTCTDPTDGSTFKKKVVWENTVSTSYGTDDLGAMEDTDQSKVNETTDISSQDFYSIVPLTVTVRGGDVVTNQLNDVVICSKPECGDCDDEDDGCEHIYAVGTSGPGSPGTAPDVIYSTDSGTTLAADEITSLANDENADALACLGDYVVVVSNDNGGIHYKLRADIDAGTGALWTRNVTNIETGGEPNDIWSVGRYAFIVGDGGYIYGLSNPITGVEVLDAAQATTQNLTAVHALNQNFAVAVGAAGTVVATEDRVTWALKTVPAAIALQAVWLVSKRIWWVGAATGAVYYTLDGGTSWTLYANFPVTLTNVEDIFFHNDSVGYITGNIAGPAGVILRTYSNGGTQPDAWVSMPETGGTFPTNLEITAGAACKYDNNFMVGVGLLNGTPAGDGIYIVATH